MPHSDPNESLIVRFFAGFAKRKAIRRFVSVLPRQLLRDYGHAGPYTSQQVESAVRRLALSPPAYWPYAVAIFCDPNILDALREECPGRPNYRLLRQEVGDSYLGASGGDFSITDLMTSRSWGHDGHGGHADGGGHGGHSGGDSGGGHH